MNEERLFNELVEKSVTIKMIVKEIDDMFEYNDFSNLIERDVQYYESLTLEAIIDILVRDGYLEVNRNDH